MAHAIIISPFSAGFMPPSDCGLKCTAKSGSAFSLRLLCHTRYGSFCGNSHRPLVGLPCQRGVTPLWTPRCRQDLLAVSGGCGLPIRTTFRRSCPLGFAAVCRDAPSRITPLLPCCKINEMQQFQAVIPVKVFLRLVGVYNRGQHIVYDGFVPDVLLQFARTSSTSPLYSSLGDITGGHALSAVQPHYPYPTAHSLQVEIFPVVFRTKRKRTRICFRMASHG